MLIFIYGQNSYLSIKKLEAMRARFIETLDPSKMNFIEFPNSTKSKFDLGEIMQAIQSPPFLVEKRMVVIKGLLDEFSTKPEAKPWIESLARIPESTIVILFEYLTVKKVEAHALYKEFQKSETVHFYPFADLTGMELNKWAQGYVKEIGLQIDRNLLNLVVTMVGSDLWQLSGELDKLSAYANGEAVSEKMIDLLVRTNSEEKIFELMDAVGSGNTNLALRCLENERNFGNSEGHLFAMLARQVRLILSVRDALDANPRANNRDIASELDIHPFVAQKTMAQANNYSLESLIKLQNLMYELDLMLKRSAVTERVAVDRVIAEMTGIS